MATITTASFAVKLCALIDGGLGNAIHAALQIGNKSDGEGFVWIRLQMMQCGLRHLFFGDQQASLLVRA